MVEGSCQQVKILRVTLSILFFVVVGCGAVIVIYPFLTPILWALVVVTTTWPLYRRLVHRLPNHRTLAAGLMTLMLAIVVFTIVIPILLMLAKELTEFTLRIRTLLESNPSVDSLSSDLASILGSQHLPIVEEGINLVRVNIDQILGFIANYYTSILGFLRSAAIGVIGAIASYIIFLLTSFYLYQKGPQLARDLELTMRSIGGEKLERLVWSVRDTVKAAVYGIVATAIGQGILAGLGYLVAGAPVPIVLGFITILFSLIPFGTPFVYIPVALYLISQGSVIAGVLLIVWGVGVVSTVDNLLRPLFISHVVNLPFIMVLFGVVGGVIGFGFIGVILGPVIFAVITALWHQLVSGQELRNK